VVFRSGEDQTEAAAASDAELEDEEWADIERYLDATRAEMVFARRVLLVEGFAEQVLLPVLAGAEEIDLDKAGITVCAIHGTHFASYIRFLDALEIRWAVITDGDPIAEGGLNGERRARRLVERIGKEGEPAEAGIFVGDTAFEFDLFEASDDNAEACVSAMEGMTLNAKARQRLGEWRNDPPDRDDFLAVVDRIGKGRLAQEELEAPPYVQDALRYLADA